MTINKLKIKSIVMKDLFQAICEQDVLKLRSQLNVIQESYGEEIRNNISEISVRESTLK